MLYYLLEKSDFMDELTKEEVLHVAHLARINVNVTTWSELDIIVAREDNVFEAFLVFKTSSTFAHAYMLVRDVTSVVMLSTSESA